MVSSQRRHRLLNGKLTPTAVSWYSMKSRCLNPNTWNYVYYGAKGITICDRWLQSFDNFLEDMGDRPWGKTLDRIDNNGGYCPENCKWSTHEEQQSNTSRSVKTNDKETKTMKYTEGMKMLTLWLDEDVHAELKKEAKRDRRSMSGYIRALLDKNLMVKGD